MHGKEKTLYTVKCSNLFCTVPWIDAVFAQKKETVRDHLLANALFLFGPDVDGRVVGIVVLGIQIILHNAQRISEPLEMHDFSFSQEFERLANIRVVDQAEKVVVGCSGFLLWYDGIRTTFEGDLYKPFHAAV